MSLFFNFLLLTMSSYIDDQVASTPTPGEKHYPKFAVSPEIEALADTRIAQYPADQKRSAVLPLLHIVQGRFGYICADAMIWVAQKLGIQPSDVLAVVSFYPGLRQSCPGKLHFRVCGTLSCAMAGAGEMVAKLCELAKIDRSKINHKNPIGISEDGMISVEFVECLAACGFGPVVLVNDDLHEKVTADNVGDLLSGTTQNA